MKTNRIKGLFEFFVLTTIPTEPMFAKEILQRLTFVGLKVSAGTLYPLLNKLRKEKLLEMQLLETDLTGPRKHYFLTTKGKVRLEEMNGQWKNLNSIVHKLRRPPHKDR